MTKQNIAKFCVLTAGLMIPAFSFAGTEGKEVKTVVEKAKESCITGDIGFAVVSEYISRGVVQENQGFIGEPYLDLYFKLYEGTGALTKVSLNFGLWSSIHSNKTAASPGTSLADWYEFDWLPGISFTFAKNLTFTASYFEFDFVSSGGRSGNLNLNLAYDDTDLLGAFAIHPHVSALKGLIGNPDGVPGAEQSWYFEIGIAPSYTFGKGGTYPVTLAVPLTLGLGDDRFYGGNTYGYFSAGASVSVPLAFVPACYGAWTLTSSATYFNLSKEAAAASAPAITNGDKNQWVFSGSIGLTF